MAARAPVTGPAAAPELDVGDDVDDDVLSARALVAVDVGSSSSSELLEAEAEPVAAWDMLPVCEPVVVMDVEEEPDMAPLLLLLPLDALAHTALAAAWALATSSGLHLDTMQGATELMSLVMFSFLQRQARSCAWQPVLGMASVRQGSCARVSNRHHACARRQGARSRTAHWGWPAKSWAAAKPAMARARAETFMLSLCVGRWCWFVADERDEEMRGVSPREGEETSFKKSCKGGN